MKKGLIISARRLMLLYQLQSVFWSLIEKLTTHPVLLDVMKTPSNSPQKLSLSAAAFAITILFGIQGAQAGYLLEIDTDGEDDGVLTYNPNFSFGGDTTTASQSSPSSAFGMTGGDSIYGGNGSESPDTYMYAYDPGVDGDNLLIPAGTDLGGGILASGKTAGSPDIYSVFATWPFTSNVSGGLTTFTATTDGDDFVISLDQNADGAGSGHEWIKLGEIAWSSGGITLTQESEANTFVSMRSAGVMFEPVPEPSTFALGALGLLTLAARRRKARNQ